MKGLLTSLGSAAALVLLLCCTTVSAQSIVFDFEDGTDQGWGPGFGNDADADFEIVNINGSNHLCIPDTGDFQEASFASGDPAWLALFDAASANPAGFEISYDYFIDTGSATFGSFLQIGTFWNGGPDFDYAQDFGDDGSPRDVDLTDVDLLSGAIFSGTITETVFDKYGDTSAFVNGAFDRFGIIINGDGLGASVHFDNITITPIAVPEPTTFGLVSLGLCGIALRRRR